MEGPEFLRTKDNLKKLLFELKKRGIALSDENVNDFLEWMKNKDNLDAFYMIGIVNGVFVKLNEVNEKLLDSYGEYLRTRSRLKKSGIRSSRMKEIVKNNHNKNKVYDDIDRSEDTPYSSGKLGLVTLDNINNGQVYIYIDNIFNSVTSNSVIKIPLTTSEFSTFRVKSIPNDLKNVKTIETSDIFISPPTNINLNTDDIIKMEIIEVANITHREFPNTNYIFQYKVETYGNRFKLVPMRSKFIFTKYVSILPTLTFRFHYQNLILEFPDVSSTAILTSGATTNFNDNSHGLVTGDKIAIYEYSGTYESIMVSLHEVTVVDPDNFTIAVNTSGPLDNVTYYILKNKIEFNLNMTYLVTV